MTVVFSSSLLLFVGMTMGFFLPPPPTRTLWLDQPIDRSPTPRTTATFKEQVLVFDTYWRASNRSVDERPIIVTMGGEGPVRGGYDHNGMLFEWGSRFGALLVFPEHRYYGDSFPFGVNNSHSRSNVQFLTVDFALQDYVDVIQHIRTSYKSHIAPVIAAGGSYPGELAAYIRANYPAHVDMALAASAPIGPNPSQYGFFRVASADFALGGKLCSSLVRQAFVEITAAFRQFNMLPIVTGLGLCQPQPPSLRVMTLWIENAFATFAMLDYPYAADDMPANPAAAACAAAESDYAINNDAIMALRAAINIVYNSSSAPVACHDITAEFYPCADPTGCGTGPNALSWDYQTCTTESARLGTNNVTDVFPPRAFDVTALDSYCSSTWGTQPDLDFAQNFADFSRATNIIFSNGLLDPWEPLGFLKSPNAGKIVTLQARGAAHHLDLRGSDPADSASVVQMRKMEQQILEIWMNSTIAARVANH
jgi:dipeptidyl-peptidase-2